MIIAWDTETDLIRPAQLAPPLVCVTFQYDAHKADQAQIEHVSTVEPRLRSWLADPRVTLVGHNIAYDLAVVCAAFPDLLPLVFAAYDADRITDTMIRQQLLDIAAGIYRGKPVGGGVFIKFEYTLEALAKRCAGMELQKDAWRLSYGHFRDVPLHLWIDKAKEVQRGAAVDLAVLQLAITTGEFGTEREVRENTELKKRIAGLESMIASDPSQCVAYPLDDARATMAVYKAQEVHASFLADQYRQARAAFAAHLSSAWGLKTDTNGVEILRREVTEQLAEVEEGLIEEGLIRQDGTRNTKAAKQRMIAICRRDKITIPRTDGHDVEGKCKRFASVGEMIPRPLKKGQARVEGEALVQAKGGEAVAVLDGSDACEEHICLDADACERTEDPVLLEYAESSTLKKVLSNDVEALAKGVEYPIHTRYGLAETGRTTSSKPNIQNWVRARKCKVCDGKGVIDGGDCPTCAGSGHRAGARECFIPRPGKVFFQADFPQLELYTLAQCCMSWLGASRLADALNAGLDPHMQIAAIALGISYEEARRRKGEDVVKDARGSGKVANFGIPGGLGIDSLVSYAKKAYGVTLTRSKAKQIKEHYLTAWPEMLWYFQRVNGLCEANADGRATVETLFTKRTRGRASYCAACNNGFQALGADCAKAAWWEITKACYGAAPGPDGGPSPMRGARIVAMVHDEFIGECDDDERAHDVAHELGRLMTVGANRYLPDVPILVSKMEPLLMRRWSKKAEPTFAIVNGEKRLIPWEP